jgi:hypothetical protein
VGLLKPGGLLSFIVTNKWMKAGYGEPLRRFFSEKAWVKSVVDFGHAKQIFVEADVFPSIIVLEKPTEAPKPKTARLCTIPREQLRIDDLSVQIEREGAEMAVSQLAVEGWQLEPIEVQRLLEKIRFAGVPLKEFVGAGPYRGVTTGLNEAFLVDGAKKRALLEQDPTSAEVIKPYLRGQDVSRWLPEFADEWMVFTRRGIDIDKFPAIKAHLAVYREQLEPKPDDWDGEHWPGRKPGPYKWYEIQDPIAFHEEFKRVKICYQEIQFHPAYALDRDGMFGNNKTSFIPSGDLYVLAALNSPLMWWHNWRFLPHMKDEALAPVGYLVEQFPIAKPTPAIREASEKAVRRLIEITSHQQQTRCTLLDWLRVEYAIEKPSNKLLAATELDSDVWVGEVKRIRGKKRPLTAAGVRALRAEYIRTIEPARALVAETLNLERTLSDLVNQAYALTPAEIELLWKTAPPRMPIPPSAI